MSSERVNPCVTPRIMLATSVRVRPWSSRERRESLGRSTRTSPLSTVTFISRSSFCTTLPLGPSTFTRPGWAVTFTLSGILMASLPMRDMAAGLLTRRWRSARRRGAACDPLHFHEHAPGSGEDRDPQAVHHLGDVGVLHVAAQARLGLPPDLADGGAPGLVVLEEHLQGALPAVVGARHLADESLVAEHLADLMLDVARGQVNLLEPRALGVADPGQQIGNWIGHAHRHYLRRPYPWARRLACVGLPGRLDHSGDLAPEGAIAETDAAHLELVQERPAAPAELAARVGAHLELRLLLQALRLRHLGELGHGHAVRKGMPK